LPEDQNIEWKSSWRDEWLERICGFANAQGGTLYVGKDDNGKVVGLANTKKLLEDIPNKVISMMGINVDVNLHVENGLEYLEIIVPRYQPGISYKGVFYKRSGSTNQRLQGASLTKFILEKQGVSWDSLTIPKVSIDDLDDGIIQRFKQMAVSKGRLDAIVLKESKADFIEKLGLIDNGELTNAAVLLFHPDPQRFFRGAQTRIGYFEEETGLRYEDAIQGSLLEQAEKVPELLFTKYLKKWVYYDGMLRDERYAFPPDAIREIVYNALIHARHGARIPIQIKVYEDAIYFGNIGGLPEHWTAETLFAKHVSEPPNPEIAHAFYLAGYIESWGQGISKICNACIAEGIDLPIYTIRPDDIMVTLKTTEKKAKGLDGYISSTISTATSTPSGGVNGGRKPNLSSLKGTAARDQLVMNAIRKNPTITQKEIAVTLGMGENTVLRAINSLKETGVLTRTGSTKKGEWVITFWQEL